MTQETISAPEVEVKRRRDQRIVSRHPRVAPISVLLAVGVHVGAALLVVLVPRILPDDTRPRELGTVEFVMVEQRGIKSPKAGQPAASKPAPDQPPETSQANTPENEPPSPRSETPAPSPSVVEPGVTATDAQAAPQDEKVPSPPSAQDALVFDLNKISGEFDAVFSGNRIIPASPDGRFRNRPPDYPEQAAMTGQHGLVVLVIHVGANGLVTGADVLQRSGVAALDQAAVTAARKWRFHPAMKEGRAVPFDVPFRFLFGDE